MTTATTSIRAKVKRYRVSVTANDNLGSMKKKSKHATDNRAAYMPATRLRRIATKNHRHQKTT